MSPIKARYDGRSIVPERPLDLPKDRELLLRIELVTAPNADAAATPGPAADESLWEWIEAHVVDDPSLPEDLSYQHDHYARGTPKKP